MLVIAGNYCELLPWPPPRRTTPAARRPAHHVEDRHERCLRASAKLQSLSTASFDYHPSDGAAGEYATPDFFLRADLAITCHRRSGGNLVAGKTHGVAPWKYGLFALPLLGCWSAPGTALRLNQCGRSQQPGSQLNSPRVVVQLSNATHRPHHSAVHVDVS
jgi:hypothetical protein